MSENDKGKEEYKILIILIKKVVWSFLNKGITRIKNYNLYDFIHFPNNGMSFDHFENEHLVHFIPNNRPNTTRNTRVKVGTSRRQGHLYKNVSNFVSVPPSKLNMRVTTQTREKIMASPNNISKFGIRDHRRTKNIDNGFGV